MNLYISYLLDETGSMEGIKDDVIGGYNSYLDTISGDDATKDARITLVKFDSSHTTKVYVGHPVSEAARLDSTTYRPGALTPLIDASVKIIKATEKVVGEDDKVIVVIHTDGHENASREHTMKELQDLVKQKTADGWEFLFLGANIDAWGQGEVIGVAMANCANFTPDQTRMTMRAMASNTVAYARSGYSSDALAFDKDTKTEAKARRKTKAPKVNAPNKGLVDEIDLSGGWEG